jgi:hypothetical protein
MSRLLLYDLEQTIAVRQGYRLFELGFSETARGGPCSIFRDARFSAG